MNWSRLFLAATMTFSFLVFGGHLVSCNNGARWLWLAIVALNCAVLGMISVSDWRKGA
jgi:hypothetical protein